jgi:hypothetical protein
MPSRSPGRLLPWLALLVSLLLLWWAWPSRIDNPPAGDGPAGLASTRAGTAPAALPVPQTEPQAAASPSPPQAGTAGAPDAPPPGVSPEQWQSLRDSLAQHPHAEQELTRLRAYLVWQDEAERFRALRQAQANQAPSEELRSLAQRVQSGIDARLRARELSAGEAALIKGATLEVLAGKAQAPALLKTWREASALASPAAPPDAREQAFAQEQQAILRAWQARPEAQRDAAALERELEAARQRHFAAKP